MNAALGRVIFRCTEAEKAELEAVAAARGQSVSAHIRERLWGSGDSGKAVNTWDELAPIFGQVSEIGTNATAARGVLAVLLFLAIKRAAPSDVTELKAKLVDARRGQIPLDLLAGILEPDIIDLLMRDE